MDLFFLLVAMWWSSSEGLHWRIRASFWLTFVVGPDQDQDLQYHLWVKFSLESILFALYDMNWLSYKSRNILSISQRCADAIACFLICSHPGETDPGDTVWAEAPGGVYLDPAHPQYVLSLEIDVFLGHNIVVWSPAGYWLFLQLQVRSDWTDHSHNTLTCS